MRQYKSEVSERQRHRRRAAARTPAGPAAPLRKPRGLAPEIGACWDDLVRDAVGLQAPDQPLVLAAAVMMHRARQAGDDIAERGMLVPNARGELEPNPSLRIERQATAELRLLAGRLGLARVERERLNPPARSAPAEEFDELAELRRRRQPETGVG